MEYFVNNAQCKNSAKTSFQNKRKFDKTTVTIKSYEDCIEKKRVKLVQVNGGGHTWPGGKQYLPEKIIGVRSREINASLVILNFFDQISQ
jgi:polyhydroxybutyrate depolymerase